MSEILIREELHTDLALYLNDCGSFQALQHPLVYMIPYFPEYNHLLNQRYAHVKKELEIALKNKFWGNYVFLHERAYRLQAFLDIISRVKENSQYWQLVSEIWIDSENIWKNLADWKKIWNSTKSHREKVMDADEQKLLSCLPDKVSIYRGVNTEAAIKGLSWTLDYDEAKWFSRRFKAKTPIVASGNVNKTDILAHFTGRNENEIVVMPNKVKIICVENVS